MRAHLIHGFNVWDGGKGSVGTLAPYFRFGDQLPDLHSYGLVGVLLLRWRTKQAVEEILPSILDGDVLVCHSHGCLIAWKLIQAGAKPGAVICIQPAMRRDTVWPEDIPVLCFYNEDDWVVSLGRIWGRFASVANPWLDRHGWGAAGRHGFDQESIDNRSTLKGPTPASGHSGFFKLPARRYWGQAARLWLPMMRTEP